MTYYRLLSALPIHSKCIIYDWIEYRQLKKTIQYECRKAHDKQLCIRLISPNNEHGNKRFWSYIKTKRKDQCGIPSLEVNHQTISDSQSKANILNDQFTSVFTTDSTANRVANLVGQPYPTIPSVQVNVNGVINLLRNLKPHKAPSPDGIPLDF